MCECVYVSEFDCACMSVRPSRSTPKPHTFGHYLHVHSVVVADMLKAANAIHESFALLLLFLFFFFASFIQWCERACARARKRARAPSQTHNCLALAALHHCGYSLVCSAVSNPAQ